MKKNNELQLTEMVKASVEIFFEQYHLDDAEEIVEYLWLRPYRTNLNVDVFVDDGGSYMRHDHIPLLLARNGYDRSVSQFIPFSISENPVILDDGLDYHITFEDISAIKVFIAANVTSLKKLADSKMSHIEFIQSIQIPSHSISDGKAK